MHCACRKEIMMASNDIAITWLGHAAFSIMTPEGKVVLIDPFLSGNPVCPANLKEPQTVDVILITHGHGDHRIDNPSAYPSRAHPFGSPGQR